MNRTYENPHALGRELEDLINRYEEAKRSGEDFDDESYYERKAVLEERINFAWQDDEYYADCCHAEGYYSDGVPCEDAYMDYSEYDAEFGFKLSKEWEDGGEMYYEVKVANNLYVTVKRVGPASEEFRDQFMYPTTYYGPGTEVYDSSGNIYSGIIDPWDEVSFIAHVLAERCA